MTTAPRFFKIDSGKLAGQYPFPEKYKLGELRLIKQIAGISTMELSDALEKGDPEALAAMVLIAMQRVGKRVTLDDILELDLEQIEVTGGEEVEEGKGEGSELNGSQVTTPVDSGTQPTAITSA